MAEKVPSDQILRVVVIYALALIGSTSRMLGEFFREAAVLLVVFVPLEFWKPTNGTFNSTTMWHVAEGTLFLLLCGVMLEFLAQLAHRIKRDLEGGHVA